MPNVTRKSALSLVAGAALSCTVGRRAASAAETPITLTTPTGNIAGTLAFPDGASAAPVVLIIAGSGPTDRDGNNALGVKCDAYKLLAAALLANGVASVRYDKRGIGASTSAATSEADLRFETYIDDAIAWIRTLAHDARFGRVSIAGHSEGSLIGIAAAQKSETAGYVSLCGAGRPADQLLHDQFAAQTPPPQLARIDGWLAQLKAGKMLTDTPSGPLAALFRASVQPYLISWFKYDPAAEIAKLHVPIAIVGGTADLQVPVSEARLLEAAAPAGKLVVVDGMAHTLKHVKGTTQADEIPAYTDPTLPVAPEVVATITKLAIHQ